jgi:mono/diheme cytochrome c family protein
MKRMGGSTLVLLALSLAATTLVFWGCGGNKPAEQTGQTPAGGTTAAPATDTAGGEVSMAVGEQVFQTNCETCHGPEGKGDGPGGAALNPKPRNFHDPAYMDTLSDATMMNTIMNGKPGTGMPAWKGILTESQIKSVMQKVHSFRKS